MSRQFDNKLPSVFGSAITFGLSKRYMPVIGLAACLCLPVSTRAEAVLEEVIVTAERREQSLQDTSISATVFSANDIFKKGIDDLNDIQHVAPGIAINTYNRSSFVNIRGVGLAQSAPTSNPGVAYYIDGLFIPHEQHIGHSFYDIASIEVLRGPQGTLTGQNSTGGAIYVRTPEPQYDSVSGYIDQTIGEYDAYRTVGALNLPISDKMGLRLAGIYNARDSFSDNLGGSSSNPGEHDLFSMRGNLQYEPNDRTKLNLRAEYYDYDSDYNPIKNRNDTVTSNPFKIEEDAKSYLRQKGYRIAAEGRFDLNTDIQMRVFTSYQDGETDDQADGDRTATALPVPAGLPASGGNRAIYPGRVSNSSTDFDNGWISEVNFLSIHDGPLQWVVGAFYMNETVDLELYRDNYHTHDFIAANSEIVTSAENTSSSVFSQINYSLSEAWELIFGLRYSEDEQEYTRFILPGPPPPGCFSCATTQESNETTGRIGLNYRLNEDTLIYGTVSKGYKAGGVNLDPRQGFFEPEINTVVELGFKTTLMGDRLRINGDIFYSDYQDIQLSTLRALFGPPLPVAENASSGEAIGGELEITGVFDELSFNLGIGYLDAEFADDVLLNNAVAGANQIVEKGDRMPFSPELSVNAGIQYAFNLRGMKLIPRYQITYIDKQLATPFPSIETIVPSRTVSDLRVTLEANEQLKLEAYATNIFDKTYIASQVQDSSSYGGGIIYGVPRQYGVRVRYEF